MKTIKIILLTIIIFIILLSFAACSDNNKANLEKNFDNFKFTLNFGCDDGINCIDIYNNKFTKDLIPGTETIDFIIPEDKMREIYEAFLEYDIAGLPDDVSGVDSMRPKYTYVLKYTWGNETRTIICDAVNTYKAADTHLRLAKFADMITEYIYSTDEYQNMSPAKGGYC